MTNKDKIHFVAGICVIALAMSLITVPLVMLWLYAGTIFAILGTIGILSIVGILVCTLISLDTP